MKFVKYWEVAKIGFFNSFVYIMDFLARALFIGLIIFILVQLWEVVYAGGNDIIEGFTISMMIWYLAMTESIVTSPGRIIEQIGGEVRSGDIAQKINKPYNYVMFNYASSLGKTLISFATTFAIASVITFLLVGGFSLKLVHLPLIFFSVFLGLTLHFLIMAMLGLFALWLEDAHALHFIYQKIIFILGGMLLPLEIFPSWLEGISKILPFSYVAYHPAKLWVMFKWSYLVEVLIGQLIWIGVAILAITIIYHIGVRRLSINGG